MSSADSATASQQTRSEPKYASSSDRSGQQEALAATANRNTQFKEEDRATNKSGDPRIGTHGRTYEPGEKKDS